MLRKFIRKNSTLQWRKLYSTKNNTSPQLDFQDPHLPGDMKKQYDHLKDKLLYSSIVEDSRIKLGFRRNRALQSSFEEHVNQHRLDSVHIDPFPVSLKYLKDDIDKKLINSTVENIKEENMNKFLHKKNVQKMLSEELDSEESLGSNWMQGYELYDEAENVNDDYQSSSQFGTPDVNVPVSKVPCYGCGAHLHCAEPSLPGYLPSELFRKKTNKQLGTMECQRCHFLKNYNTAINVSVSPEDYIKIVSTIEDKFALAILMVDLLDFPCSIWPGIKDILGEKRPIFVVGNKVDLLPKDSKGYLNHIKQCLSESILDAGFTKSNVKYISLISAQTGYGIEELITKLHNVWGPKGDVYLVGCTNVGKSSLFNALLRSDYCKTKASNIINKATVNPWPGTTLRMLKFPILRPSDGTVFLRTKRIVSQRFQRAEELQLRRDQARITGKSEHATLIGSIGRTFEKIKAEEKSDPFTTNTGQPLELSFKETDKDHINSKWCYDTPGVMQPNQITNLLTTQELIKLIPKEMIRVRAFLLKKGMSFFLAGLGRIDYLDGVESIRLTLFASLQLPTLITPTEDADEVYAKLLGTDFLGVPCGDHERLDKWPALEYVDNVKVVGEEKYLAACDFVLSSAGWVGINIPRGSEATFRIWTPEARGIFIRKPSLIPFGINLKGERIRRSLAYKLGKSFVKL